jgi:hypothetical protein
MEWILAKLPILIFVVVFAAKIFEAIMKARKTKTEHESGHDDAAEQRRVAEVQEQIRRRIAERRGEAPTPPAPPASTPVPRPIIRRAETTELPDPMGGTLRRVFEEMERKLQPPPVTMPEPPPLVQHRRAELERQQELADQLKALEEQRALAQRRAMNLAAEVREEAESERGVLSAGRTHLLDDLRDPQSLRRAFVLREVLGPPVGLR